MALNIQAEDVTPEPQLTIPDVLPVLPLRNVVIYPLMGQGLTVGQERSVRLVDDAMRGDRLVALATQIDPNVESPGPEGVRTIGTVGRILQMMRRPDGVMLVAVQGLERIRVRRNRVLDHPDPVGAARACLVERIPQRAREPFDRGGAPVRGAELRALHES